LQPRSLMRCLAVTCHSCCGPALQQSATQHWSRQTGVRPQPDSCAQQRSTIPYTKLPLKSNRWTTHSKLHLVSAPAICELKAQEGVLQLQTSTAAQSLASAASRPCSLTRPPQGRKRSNTTNCTDYVTPKPLAPDQLCISTHTGMPCAQHSKALLTLVSPTITLAYTVVHTAWAHTTWAQKG